MHSFPGVSLNLNALPMNPAIVAAALNQWSLMGNLQNQGGGNQEVKIDLFINHPLLCQVPSLPVPFLFV